MSRAGGQQGLLREPPSAEVAGIFSPENPKTAFTDLQELGRGAFGFVYQGVNKHGEAVAIKQMKVAKGFNSEEWQEILKEIRLLSSCRHANILEFKGCYRDELTIWLITDLCMGSVCDLMDVFKAPFAEDEIAVIITECLKALEYLHGTGKIHRDVKGGNVMITDDGHVKLGDFGSGTMSEKANSFIGSAYWMAPEVILAMESGTYDGKVDIWSLGITCIELAERKPPLFEMNVMSALYHIPQNDPPTLKQPGDWTPTFATFIAACLSKEPEERPTAAHLRENAFVTIPRKPNVLKNLALRAKDPALLQENQEIKDRTIRQANDITRMSESLISSSPSSKRSSHLSDSIAEEPEREESATSATSGSAEGASKKKKDEVPALQSTVRKLVEETPLQRVRNVRQHKSADNDLDLRQLSEIRKIRKAQQQELKALQTKQDGELIRQSTQDTREFETLRRTHDKDMEKLKVKHTTELEEHAREEALEEKSQQKQVKEDNKQAWVKFQQKFEREYKSAKEQLKQQAGELDKGDRKARKKDLKDKQEQEKVQGAEILKQILETKESLSFLAFRTSRLPMKQALENRQLQEELALRRQHSAQLVEFKQKRLIVMEKMLRTQLEDRFQLQVSHSDKLTEVEMEQHEARSKAKLKAMKKTHLAELKRQPKELRDHEDEIRKKYTDTVKLQNKQAKALAREISGRLPKAEQFSSLQRHKAEQALKLARLEEDYRMALAELSSQLKERLLAEHDKELKQLEVDTENMRKALASYQQLRRDKTVNEHKTMLAHVDKQKAALTEELNLFEQEQKQKHLEEAKREEQLLEQHKKQTEDLERRLTSMQQDLAKMEPLNPIAS